MANSFYHQGRSGHLPHMNNNTNAGGHHQHHGGRSRRAHRQVKQVRAKEVVESINVTNFRRDFEAARSFELEDDEIFCPFNLLTEDDVSSPSSRSCQDRCTQRHFT